MATKEDFIKKSEIERMALSSIIPLLFEGKEYTYYTTPSDGFDVYDGYVMLFNTSGSIIGRYMVEVKVRDTHYDELMLERKKYNDLVKASSKTEAGIIYINVTPNGTYCFNINKIIDDNTNWVIGNHWKSTTDKSLGKIDKKIVYIPIDKAKKIEYNTVMNHLQLSREAKITELFKESKEMKQQFCLFRDVLMK